jgi:hypothetical protein
MAPKKAKTIRKIADLTPDAQNPNRGTERGVYAVETSLEKYGAGRSILVDARGRVIAGNKTLQAAADKGFGVEVVQTTGDTLIVVQRTDLDLDDPAGAARALSVADNRAGELGLDWDPVAMSSLVAGGMDVGTFFSDNEMAKMLAGAETFEPTSENVTPQRLDEYAEKKCPECGAVMQCPSCDFGKRNA